MPMKVKIKTIKQPDSCIFCKFAVNNGSGNYHCKLIKPKKSVLYVSKQMACTLFIHGDRKKRDVLTVEQKRKDLSKGYTINYDVLSPEDIVKLKT